MFKKKFSGALLLTVCAIMMSSSSIQAFIPLPPPNWAYKGYSYLINSQLGASVANAGDVNHDGYDDIIVGAPTYNGKGSVFLFSGGPKGLGPGHTWYISSDQNNSQFGNCVAGAGDVNGDGYADVIIGAYNYTNGETGEGRCFLFLGGPSGLATTPAWIAEGNQANAKFGYSVAGAGDINHDGYSDVIVGAPYFSNGQSREGCVFVFIGGPNGISATPAWTFKSDRADSHFGESVAGAGDVNNDGYADIIVGSSNYSQSELNEGMASVFLGDVNGLSNIPSWVNYGGLANSHFGQHVTCAGDVNTDGYDDILVGAPGYSSSVINQGKAYCYLGGPNGPAATPSWTDTGSIAQTNFGIVGPGGDVNGDGYDDIIIGSFYSKQQLFRGRAYFYFGGSSGLTTNAAKIIDNDTYGWDYSYFSNSVLCNADVNKDGYTDLLFGEYQYDTQYKMGAVFCYYGGFSLPQAPSVQASSLKVNTAGMTHMEISWTRGNGKYVAVFMAQTDTGSANPQNGLEYEDQAYFGSGSQIDSSGWYSIYNSSYYGNKTSVSVSGLTPDKPYRIMVCEFNNGGAFLATTNYLVSTTSGNLLTQATLPANLPPRPELDLPIDNAREVFNLKFTWHSIYEVDSYRIQVSTDSNFSTLDYDIEGIIDTIMNYPGPLNPSTIYYWRVCATNAIGTGDWSNIRNFTIYSYIPTPVPAVLTNGLFITLLILCCAGALVINRKTKFG